MDVGGKLPLQNSRALRTGLNVLSKMPGQTCAICSQGGQEPTGAWAAAHFSSLSSKEKEKGKHVLLELAHFYECDNEGIERGHKNGAYVQPCKNMWFNAFVYTCLELTRIVRQWVKGENFFGPSLHMEKCCLWMLKDIPLLSKVDAEPRNSSISTSVKVSLLSNKKNRNKECDVSSLD